VLLRSGCQHGLKRVSGPHPKWVIRRQLALVDTALRPWTETVGDVSRGFTGLRPPRSRLESPAWGEDASPDLAQAEGEETVRPLPAL